MPSFQRNLDVYQGFNFKKDQSTAVGFITKLTIGGTALAVDIESVKDPMNPTAALKCVAVLNNYLWDMGPSDAVYLSGQISTKNKMTLQTMLMNDLTNIEVKVEYALYEYDPLAKKYFQSNYLNAELDGIIEKRGSDLTLSVADDASSEVQSPQNYALQIGVKPAPLEQTINVATGFQKTIVKKWGTTVTA